MADNNKREQAVAVKYDNKKMNAPTVVAKGEGFIARKIIERAVEADVPIVEDAALVSALISLELGEEIPAELYEVVARVLAWVYKLDKETAQKPS
ncbi:MAG: EscU/YscU/HrcU family type III secretion system export apparatus switch protein [Synergistaceae bacterium]|nr:EscU/YscU/HrcU family type III secretion system export apparatus switch protein [Synergistaceae bacterium]MBR0093837.1 EscU/YscU/HrcU family type III secretion system export apparatus switch protein [Synergistaceae bacterium]